MTDALQTFAEFGLKLERERITDYDRNLLQPFIVKLREKFSCEVYIDKETLAKILSRLSVERVFLRMPCLLERYLSPKRGDLKLFSGDVVFEYTGSDVLSTEYATLPLCDVFFVRKNEIILWDHEGRISVYRFERVKASKI